MEIVALESEAGLEVWRQQDYVYLLTSDANFHGLVAMAAPAGVLDAREGNATGPGTQVGPLVGFIAGRILRPDAEIYKLAVTRDFRRAGIGSLLIQAFVAMAMARGVLDCFLEVRQSNLGAVEFYHRHGFVVHRARPGYYANPVEDAYVMLRRGEDKR